MACNDCCCVHEENEMGYRPRNVQPEDQVGEVGGNIVRALPNALKMLQSQGIVTARQAAGYAKDLPRLSCALAAMFKRDLYNSSAEMAALLEKNYIDCDAIPVVPDGHGVTEHKRSGRLFWDSERQGDALLLPSDRDGGEAFVVSDVMGKIQNLPVLNANVLDSLLGRRHPTPERWEWKKIYFPGSLYFVYGRGPIVRGLYKQDNALAEVMATLKEVWTTHLIALRA